MMDRRIKDRTLLQHWMGALLNYVRSGQPDLTNRQLTVMLVVYLDAGPHTVRGLAETLGVSKPVITRALNRLGTLGYLRRQRDEQDRRSVFVAITAKGVRFLESFAGILAESGQRTAAAA